MGGPVPSLAPPTPSSLSSTRPRRHVGSTRSTLRHFPGLAAGEDCGVAKRSGRVTTETTRTRTVVAGAALNRGQNGAPLPPSASARTYSASISTDLPLQEPPWASFDEYLEDQSRVFTAMFPDKRRSQRLNDEEWRINMLPIQFLLVSANPVIDMRVRCRLPSKESPSGFPLGVTRVLELEATRWELQGLDSVHMPQQFELNVQGVLYADRSRGRGRSRLKGDLQMSIKLVLPTAIALLPEEVVRNVAESVLRRLVERMKQEVDVSLIADYRDFSEEVRKQRRMKAVIRHSSRVPLKREE